MRLPMTVFLFLMAGVSAITATEYVVEVYFVVEPQTIRNYVGYGYDQATAITTITKDIDYFVYQINEFFQSTADYGLDIKVRAKHVNIMDSTDALFEDCVLVYGADLQADVALAKFKEWLTNTNAQSVYGYDMAVVWTGYDLFSTAGDNSISGYATVSATCTDVGIAIAEFDGTMSTATTTAHEIAHSMGAPHADYSSAECLPDMGYIMKPTSNPTNDNRWSFSSCTAAAMQTYITSLDSNSNNCLVQTTTAASSFQLADAVSTDIMDPEKVCKRSKNSLNYYFCHYSDFYNPLNGDDVCQFLKCGLKGTLSCATATPSDGMVCDHNKRCSKGKCVTSSIPTGDVDSACVFGDIESEYIGSAGQTCQDYVGEDKAACYTEWVREDRCCATCKAMSTGIPDCEWGDKNPACSLYTPAQICGSSCAVCCETCHGYVAKRSVRHRKSSDVNLSDLSQVDNDPLNHPTNATEEKKPTQVTTA